MTAELDRLPELIDTLNDALQGERDGTMRVPVVDLRIMLTAMRQVPAELHAIIQELATEGCRAPVLVDGEGRRVHWMAPGWHGVGCGSCLTCRAQKAIGVGEFYDPTLGDGTPHPMSRRQDAIRRKAAKEQ